MMISFEVDFRGMETIRLAFCRFGDPGADYFGLDEILGGAMDEVRELETALREVIRTIDADPATYATTTMKLVRSIAAKALSEKGEGDTI